MSKKLLTILGKARENQDYSEARYQFKDGEIVDTKYFGLAVKHKEDPDEIIVLGTTGSMWDNLFLNLFSDYKLEDDLDDPKVSTLMEELSYQLKEDAANQELLNRLANYLSPKIKIKLKCRLISYAETEEKQFNFIENILSLFKPGDDVVLDITHGLRHLPLLIQQVVTLLPMVRETKILGVYYGALDLTKEDVTPVMRLDKLTMINEWSSLLKQYDRTGNIALFSPLFEEVGVPKEIIDDLNSASFFQQTNNVKKAQNYIKSFITKIKKVESEYPLLSLLLPSLISKLEQVGKGKIWQQKFEWAKTSLECRDYVRAALFAYEAFIERFCDEKEISNLNIFEEKNDEIFKYMKSLNKHSNLYKKHREMRLIRNTLAHGMDTSKISDKSNQDIKGILSNENELRACISSCIKILQTERL
ncbi:TIGR02221 family CRISPR-associated protein [Gallibacterium anatis]|uniref:TIGR02221 family CRISPR-associated protein n=1 Tax=Gallibacterium anatis TaxID=750 RepID=UPI00266F5824|nr:TIGR02221 family CRISPR-associated protein [Gallibacterium anatis]WKS96422.1 TIGR02221 family CRISPR-associated protein [Gallibacterium anatis]